MIHSIAIVNSSSYPRFKNKFNTLFLISSWLLLITIQPAKSHEIFLKCTGKFEINRGELIKPDWETSYLKVNMDGLISTIVDKGVRKKGKTFIRRNLYTITYRDKYNILKTKYRINGTYGTYVVDYPQLNRTLIGICQKSRG